MSLASGIIDAVMKQLKTFKNIENEEKFAEYLERKRKANSKKFVLRYPFNKNIIVETQRISNMQYFVFNRKFCKKTIFYFHGGSYIDRPLIFHFRYIEKFLKEREVCVVFPIYPRLPNNTYVECYKKLIHLFDDFASKNEVDEVVFMGDSAGGGLALGMAQQIKLTHDYFNQGKQKVILLSPWLDVATDNQVIKKIQPNDYQLSQVRLNKLGLLWSNNKPKQAPASPLFGDIDCGEITLITGTREILYPDDILLKQKVESCGLKINFYQHDNMSHCFMLMPIPEADMAFKQLLNHI